MYNNGKLTAQEKDRIRPVIKEVILSENLPKDADGWVYMAEIGNHLVAAGIQYKQYGFQRLRPFLEQFQDVLEITFDEKTPPNYKVKVKQTKPDSCSADTQLSKTVSNDTATVHESIGNHGKDNSSTESEKPPYDYSKDSSIYALGFVPNFDKQFNYFVKFIGKEDSSDDEKETLKKELRYNIKNSYDKGDMLYYTKVLNGKHTWNGKFSSKSTNEFWVNTCMNDTQGNPIYITYEKKRPDSGWLGGFFRIKEQGRIYGNPVPIDKQSLKDWAYIPIYRYRDLAEMALEEKWYYGSPPTNTEDIRENYPILISYINYTFQRLVYEQYHLYEETVNSKERERWKNKLMIYKDSNDDAQYAAFNTGLVNKTYDCIYALFEKNDTPDKQYWKLCNFVVPGIHDGKTLTALFNPLPKRTNYFNNIQDMLYDPSTGDLACDWKHILIERISRFPVEFLTKVCPFGFLDIDGTSIDDVYDKPDDDETKVKYYTDLSDNIKNDYDVLNDIKDKLEKAQETAIKRVEWNYKTAIPAYYPTDNTGTLLLPLSLVEKERIDLALVVERQPSGNYIGHTVIPLSYAYSNSRLITRPDSDWLKTEAIMAGNNDDDLGNMD